MEFPITTNLFIAILDFEYDEQATPKFRRDVCLKDQDGDIFFDKLNFKQYLRASITFLANSTLYFSEISEGSLMCNIKGLNGGGCLDIRGYLL